MTHEFYPFEKVLVRSFDTDEWIAHYYSHYELGDEEDDTNYHIMVGGEGFPHCIPYEGNEHLFRTKLSPAVEYWQPKLSEKYYTIESSFSNTAAFTPVEGYYDEEDAHYVKSGNCFKTREEAEAVCEELNKKFLSRDFEDI